jgi:acyl-CoA synthetase (AMP-forming)/AMP-acid ligase II
MSTGEMTIPELVARAAAEHGDRLAVLDGDMRLTFAELAAKVRQCGRSMLAYGVQPGDRVAVWAPNSWEWVVTALGAVSVGGVLVPLNTRLKAAEAAYILSKTRTKLIAVGSEFLGVDYVAETNSIRDRLPELETLTVFSDLGTPPVISRRQFRGPAGKVPASMFTEAAASLTSDSVGDLFFTSGTTGSPKGVEATHGQTTRCFEQWAEIVGLQAGDRYLMVNPYSHTFGYKAGILACLMRGATMVPLASFDATAILEAVQEYRITVLPGAPAVYQMMLAHPLLPSFDLSSLRLAVTGAAVIPVELVHRMLGKTGGLGFDTVVTAYGLTEATGVVTICRQGDDPEVLARTSGRAIEDVEVRILTHDGELRDGTACRDECVGEIVVRGYNVMRGYFEDPAATAEAVDADGWLHTGDIGQLSAEGNLRITDRIKDMYICGGFNAYPAEIEQVLVEHPSIAEAAVIGVPDERLGEVGKAFVVATPGVAVDVDAVLEYARKSLANYKVPRHVEVVETFPRSSLGKVLKRELR